MCTRELHPEDRGLALPPPLGTRIETSPQTRNGFHVGYSRQAKVSSQRLARGSLATGERQHEEARPTIGGLPSRLRAIHGFVRSGGLAQLLKAELSSGGGLDIGSFEEALVPAGVAFFASLFYWLWANWVSPFVTPGLSKLTGRLMAATSKSKK